MILRQFIGAGTFRIEDVFWRGTAPRLHEGRLFRSAFLVAAEVLAGKRQAGFGESSSSWNSNRRGGQIVGSDRLTLLVWLFRLAKALAEKGLAGGGKSYGFCRSNRNIEVFSRFQRVGWHSQTPADLTF